MDALRAEYELKIAKLKKRNKEDHDRMRLLRNELLAQSREADQLARENDSILSQSGLRQSTVLGSSSRVQPGLNSTLSNSDDSGAERLDALAAEYSEMRRDVDALMYSGSRLAQSAIPRSTDDSSGSLFQTAVPFARTGVGGGGNMGRQSSIQVHQSRRGSLNFHIGAPPPANISSGGSGNLGVEELQ